MKISFLNRTLLTIKKIYFKIIWSLSQEEASDLLKYLKDRNEAAENTQEPRFDPSNLNPKSDTVFILGCSESINNITQEEWDVVQQHDSLALNYFYIHDFRPTYHAIELGQSEESLACVENHLLKNPDRSNESVFFQERHLLKRRNFKLQNTFSNVFYYYPSVPQTLSKKLITHILKRWYGKGNALIHHSSNLDAAVNIAYTIGYKNIVLLGTDLSGNEYFWDTQNDIQRYSDIRMAIEQDNKAYRFDHKKLKTHATINAEITKSILSLKITDYLKILNNSVLTPHGVNISVASPTSILTSYLPESKIINHKIQ